MQTVTLILFTALILGFLLLFLLPGRWWPRRPPTDGQETSLRTPPAPPDADDEPPEPPRYPRNLN